MKAKKQRIRDLLGLTQGQLSLLLEVGHSQLSLYELGLRRLPATAVQKMAEMIAVVNTAASSAFMKSRAAEEAVERQVTLEKLRKENSYQQERLSRILVPLEQKYQSNVTALYLVQQLGVEWKTKAPHQIEYLGALKNSIGRALEKNSYSKLVQYQIRLKVLQQEEVVLREALRPFDYAQGGLAQGDGSKRQEAREKKIEYRK